MALENLGQACMLAELGFSPPFLPRKPPDEGQDSSTVGKAGSPASALPHK